MACRGGAAGVRKRASVRATDRELVVVAAVLAAGSENAAAHRLGLSHSTVKHHLASARPKVGAQTTAQLVWILGARLPELGPSEMNPGTLRVEVRHAKTERPGSRINQLG